MSEVALPLSDFPADLLAVYPQADLLWGVLEASLTGLALYAPVRDAAGTLVDFRIDLLNPAAQRLLGQPAQPSGTYLQHYPNALATGLFAFHRDVFESGAPAQLNAACQAEGLAKYVQLSARRVGEGLLVSFTDPVGADRSEVEVALRASHTQQQAARAAAEQQRQQFEALVDQAPVALGFFEGPELRIMAANQQLCHTLGYVADEILHRPLLEAVPELQGQGFDDLLRQVMATEVPVVGTETPARMLRNGQLTTTYYDFVYKPFYNAQGEVQGVIDVAVEVTAQVVARQQHQALADELLAANKELEAVATAVEQARAAAELQRRQLHHVLEQAPAMICIFDGPQHTFQFVNPPYQALVGDRPLVGQPIAQAMPELVGQPVFGLLDHVYQTGETFQANEMLVQLDHRNEGPRDLEKRYYNFIYQARHNLAEAVDGILVFAYDVTPQVLARQEVEHAHAQVQNLNEELAASNEELRASNEEYLLANSSLHETQQQLRQFNQELELRVQERTQQIREQSSRLERLVQEAPAAICILDGPELVFELLNPGYEALFPGRELLGKPLLTALPELRNSLAANALRRVYETGTTFEGCELLLNLARPADGQLEARYFDFIFQARYNAAGSINGLVLFGFEVTEQVRNRQQVHSLNEELAAINQELQATNDELATSNSQLTRTNVDLDNFVYTASHDLKAPIANIEGLLLALQYELPAAHLVGQVPTILRLMQQAIERFGRTIGHLTDVSRLQKEYRQPTRQLDLARVVHEVQLDLAPLIEAAEAQVLVDIPAEATLLFSEKNLRSVVYNLLSNAVKYRDARRPAVVRVAYQPQGAYQLLVVQDNGLGMDLAQSHDKLFAMFQRLHAHVEGTGIGLYMVKKMVENAGGRIEVQSELGHGSTFTVYFPR